MSEFQVYLRLSTRESRVKTVHALDAMDAVRFAESLVPRSTAKGVVELTPYVSV